MIARKVCGTAIAPEAARPLYMGVLRLPERLGVSLAGFYEILRSLEVVSLRPFNAVVMRRAP